MPKRTTGPSYDTRTYGSPKFYRWKCPACGDICEDPANVHESECHAGHEVKLTVTDDGHYQEAMVAELAERSPKSSVSRLTKRKRRKQVVEKVHRQIESLEFQAICGATEVRTTYDWTRVTCKQCLSHKHNYELHHVKSCRQKRRRH